MSAPVLLQRETFQLSRAMEFFSERELTAQIGYTSPYWPVALLKELLDNALDACESGDIAPVIAVELQNDLLIVADNGPGLPLATLERSLDYTVRISDKTGYVSPSRGQQGNALKTLWAAPFVATGAGLIEVETAAYRRVVEVTLDRIAQAPRLELRDDGTPDVKSGTKITVHWPGVASLLVGYGSPDFYSAIHALTDFNPHCTLTVNARGDHRTYSATAPGWQHWRPDRPTAPQWYTGERFRALVALLLNHEQRTGKARSVNEFIREFHGLSGTAKAKAIAAAADLTGVMLRDLIRDGDLSMDRLTPLLRAMKEAARPVKPEALGLLGQEHLSRKLERYSVATDSIEYRRAQGEADGLPYVLEVAFGVKTEGNWPRTLRVGINFSPALIQPFPVLDAALTEARCTGRDPVALLVHLACPLVQFADRGKTRAQLPAAIADDLQKLVRLVTARFTQAKRQADRADRMESRALDALRNAHRVKPMSVKAAAWKVMETAYLKASNNGTLPANARQIMYAARPLIIELTGKTAPWKKSATFTQTHLPNFINAHPELCANWDVVWDRRGHFAEPHTQREFGIGGVAVRRYLAAWNKTVPGAQIPPLLEVACPTHGPALRYRFALFVEKEGFIELLESARIAERYDIAFMSTKGMSVTASRQLVERLSEAGVTTLVMRDFDQSGFTICHFLQNDNRRYRFKTAPRVFDLGLRLGDVESMNLDSEPVEYRGDADPRPGMIAQGATPEEADYLVTGKKDGQWVGQRVELNAMPGQQLLDWLEGKLEEFGVVKFVPSDVATLTAAWERAWRIEELNKAIVAAAADLKPPEPPADLADRIRVKMLRDPNLPWDAALL